MGTACRAQGRRPGRGRRAGRQRKKNSRDAEQERVDSGTRRGAMGWVRIRGLHTAVVVPRGSRAVAVRGHFLLLRIYLLC